FIHPHHLPRRRILFVQLRRFRNQSLHSRPLHINQTPQPYATHALRLALQQFLGIGKHRSPQKCQRHMLFPQHKDAQRSVRIKCGSLPRAYVFLAVCRRFLYQRPHRFHYSRKFPRLLHVRVNPQPSLFPFNGWHLASSSSPLLQPLILVRVPSSRSVLPTSPVPPSQSSPAPSNTRPPFPAPPAHTQPTPHRESLARSAFRPRN